MWLCVWGLLCTQLGGCWLYSQGEEAQTDTTLERQTTSESAQGDAIVSHKWTDFIDTINQSIASPGTSGDVTTSAARDTAPITPPPRDPTLGPPLIDLNDHPDPTQDPTQDLTQDPITASEPPLAALTSPPLLTLDPLEALVIEGLIVDAKGAPIPEADVELSGEAGAVSRTHTELDGRFVTEALPLDLYEVRVTAPGYSLSSARGVAPGGPTLKLSLSRGGALIGRVIGPDGQGVQATLHIGGAGSFPPRVARSDATGAFEVRGLPAGQYQALALAADLGSAWPVRAEVQGGDAPTDALEVVVHPGHTLKMQVRGLTVGIGGGDAELVVEGALVTLSAEALHVLALYDVSDSSGEISFRGLPAGRYYVAVRAPGYLTDQPRWVEVPSPDTVAITLGRGVTVEGRALDRDGRPVAGAKVAAHIKTTAGAFWVIEDDRLGVLHRLVRPDGLPISAASRRFSTDADGRFRLSGLPPGEVEVEVIKPGLIPARTTRAALEEGAVSAGHTLTLLPGVGVAGEVQAADGSPLAGAQVRWRMASDVGFWRAQARSNGAGAFTFDAVGDDVVFEALSVAYAPLVAPMRLDLSGASPQRVVLRFAAGEGGVFGHVLGPSGGVIAGADVAAWAVDAPSGAAAACRARTDGAGVFRLERCGAGRKRVEVRAPGAAPAWAEVEVGHDLEVRLSAGGALNAQVVAPQGAPALTKVKVSVTATSPQADGAPHRWEQVWAVSDGLFSQQNLPPGDYSLTFSAADCAPQALTAQVTDSGEVSLGEVTLAPLRQAKGFVVDYYRASASGARVWVAGHPAQAVTADGEGRFLLTLPPGEDEDAEIEAVHWLYGRGGASTSAGASGDDIILALTLPLDHGQDPWPARFSPVGVALYADGHAWAVASLTSDSPWLGAGLKEGDLIESVSPSAGPPAAVTVVRARRRHTLRLPP